LGSTLIVLVFGQLLLPHALTNDPSKHRTSGGVVVGAVVLVALLSLHLVYWARVRRHFRAEWRLHRELTERFDQQLTVLRAGTLGGTWPSLAALFWSIPLAVAISMLALSLQVLIVVTKALLSPAGSVDSPLLATIFLGVAILPFGGATVAIGCSRARLVQLRSEIRMLGL
jgi:galactitol-specific phosphotransferase system IIC component